MVSEILGLVSFFRGDGRDLDNISFMYTSCAWMHCIYLEGMNGMGLEYSRINYSTSFLFVISLAISRHSGFRIPLYIPWNYTRGASQGLQLTAHPSYQNETISRI